MLSFQLLRGANLQRKPSPTCEKCTCGTHEEGAALSGGRIDSGGIPRDLMLWAIIFPSIIGIPFASLCAALLGPMHEITVSYFMFLDLALNKDI